MKRLMVALSACLALAACGRHDGVWRTDNIDGLMPTLEFSLIDDTGRPVSAQDYRGKTVLLYFGYTSCPDECPTTLSKLALALKQAKDHGAGDVVLFVTVDPQRDSAGRLYAYTRAFGPQFVGLRGTPQELTALSKRYRITYSYGKPDKNGDYEVMHSTGVFVFDGTGRSRLLVLPEDPADAIAADLDRLAG
ncbi:MAG TPA: SCO family protein [Burkholderiales bacterium]|nr:SCO family protein [Burkholderiales bacterium]